MTITHEWTPEQDEALRAMLIAGMTPADIADELIDIPQQQIQQRAIWLMLPKPHARSA